MDLEGRMAPIHGNVCLCLYMHVTAFLASVSFRSVLLTIEDTSWAADQLVFLFVAISFLVSW